MPQVPFLFAGSVADNIRYGRPDASDAEVAAAARQLGDGSWIDALPNGLHTDVGERGAQLSLGQRQLVALARVLLQDPAILLLDEATASIDPFTERQIQAGLASVMRGRTSIVIAHRLSTVRTADRIIVLRAGRSSRRATTTRCWRRAATTPSCTPPISATRRSNTSLETTTAMVSWWRNRCRHASCSLPRSAVSYPRKARTG